MSALKVDIRNLVYKLCEGRKVPLLVTDIIAGCLVRRDLFNINTLSRSLNMQANAIIYRDVIFSLDGSEWSVKKASLLYRTLLTSKTAARAVHTLSLVGDPLQTWRVEVIRAAQSEGYEDQLRGRIPPTILTDLTDFTQGEIELHDHVATLALANMHPTSSDTFVGILYLQLLRSMPCFQNLSVSSDYFRFPDFRNTLQEMAQDSSFGKLRSCSLCLDLQERNYRHASAIQDWDSALLALFALPDIQSIAAVVSLRPEAIRQLRPGGSSITRLDLNHYQDLCSDLDSLLAATPSLRYLKYHVTTDYNWLNASCRNEEIPEHGICFEPLYKALHHVSDSLEELHTSQDFDEDSCHYSPGFGGGYEPLLRQKVELSSIRRLHTLTIPFRTLLEWTREDDPYNWDRTLPSSLRNILLTDQLYEIPPLDHWTDEDFMPGFSRLVEWLSVGERANEATEFALHIADLRSEFNEPVRLELTRMCKEHGVRCSIEKVHADYQKPPAPWLPRGGGRGNMTRGRGRGRGM